MRRALTDFPLTDPPLIDRIRRAARQEQFLDVVSAEEAARRFRSAISLLPLGAETVGLHAALGRVVAETDMATPSSASRSIRAMVDLPAPEGLDRTKRRPRRWKALAISMRATGLPSRHASSR